MTDMGKQVRELLPEYPHLWSRVITWAEKERARMEKLLPDENEEMARYELMQLAARLQKEPKE